MNIMKTVLLIVVMATLSLCSTLSAGERQASPNVVLLSVDTLRADRLSGYGHTRKTSPNIDALMKRGVRFENAYTVVPLTAPCFSSVMMSRYPHETGLTRNGLSVKVKFPTMAEVFRKAGYATGCVQSNWTVKRESGLDRGFDHYDDDFKRIRSVGVTERDAKYVTKFAMEWLESIRKKKKPFFLWAHYSDPHSPYIYRKDFKLPLLESELFLSPGYRYDTEVAYADHYIGKLIQGFRAKGLLKNTIILFMADHGESLGEHAYYGHGRQVYEPMLKVPMAVTGPGIERGAVSNNNVMLLDVMPTILGLAGLECPRKVRGHSIIGPDGAPNSFNRAEYFFETYRGHVFDLPGIEKVVPGVKPLLLGMRRGEWKFIYNPESGETELYNMQSDPGELINLCSRKPSMRSEMVGKVTHWHKTTNPYMPKRRQRISNEEREKLKALGYIQ